MTRKRESGERSSSSSNSSGSDNSSSSSDSSSNNNSSSSSSSISQSPESEDDSSSSSSSNNGRINSRFPVAPLSSRSRETSTHPNDVLCHDRETSKTSAHPNAIPRETSLYPNAVLCHDGKLARTGRRLTMRHLLYKFDRVFGGDSNNDEVTHHEAEFAHTHTHTHKHTPTHTHTYAHTHTHTHTHTGDGACGAATSVTRRAGGRLHHPLSRLDRHRQDLHTDGEPQVRRGVHRATGKISVTPR
jgi:hypothetical protein